MWKPGIFIEFIARIFGYKCIEIIIKIINPFDWETIEILNSISFNVYSVLSLRDREERDLKISENLLFLVQL